MLGTQKESRLRIAPHSVGGGVSQCSSNGKHVRGGTCEERIKRKYKGKIHAKLREKGA
jgi:hypothetical protein